MQVTSIIDSPDADPHDYEPTAGRRPGHRDRGRRAGQRGRLRRVGQPARRRQPEPGPDRRHGRVRRRCRAGDNPHRWYDPDDVRRRSSDAARGRPTSGSTRPTRPTSTGSAQTFADHRDGCVPGRDRRHQDAVRGDAGRRVGVDLRDGRAGTRARPGDPRRLPARGQRGDRPTAADKATIDAQIATRADQGLRLQQPERDPGRAAAGRRGHVRPASRSPRSPRPWCPPDGTWQDWQTGQLTALRDALAKATGR